MGAAYQSILVAYDDTEPSKLALERAAALAEASGAKVLVTSILAFGHSSPKSAQAMHRSASFTADEEVRSAQAILEGRGIAAESVEATGDPASAIADLAERHGVDLVVVGSRGLGPVKRLLGQSVSQAVSRRVRCDVLIVHPGRGAEELS